MAKMGVIVWYEANLDYVANVLCENKSEPQLHCEGKCYLKKQLNKVDNPQESKQLPEKKAKSELPEYITSTSQFISHTIFTNITHEYSRYTNLYFFSPVSSIFHPPPVC